jgi:hypothetical protein
MLAYFRLETAAVHGMNFQVMGLITVILGLAGLWARVSWVFTLMMISTVFGAAAAFALAGLGGASVLVPSLFLMFFCMRVFVAFGESEALAAVAPPRPGFFLLLLTLYGVASAIFFPRFFAGMTQTMLVERSVGTHSFISLVPLRFSANNITQTIYAISGLVCFAFTFAFFRRSGTPNQLITAILIVCGVDLGFALLDIVTYFTHTDFLMSFVRTANYALLTNAEKGGLKRISGTFPEASAFADYTLALFALSASLWLDRMRPRASGILAILCLLALILSTSATALVGVAAILPVLCLRSIMASRRDDGGGRPVFLVAMAVAVPLVAIAIPVVFPDVADNLYEFVNEMLLSKADSQSGRERSMWNATAYQSFLDTSGWGAGLGSARASSFVVVLLSNLGVVGTGLFVIFVLLIFLSNTSIEALGSPERVSAARAGKVGLAAVLLTNFVSGTVYDLGLVFYLLAGSVAAMTSPVPAAAESKQASEEKSWQDIVASGAWR